MNPYPKLVSDVESTSGQKDPGVQIEPRVELTPLHEKLSTGFTRLPNHLLMLMAAGELTKNEAQLVLLIARLTISFDRAYVALSKGLIARYTGIQGRAFTIAMAALLRRGLVIKVAGSYRAASRYGLVVRTQVQSEPRVEKTLSQNEPQGWGQISPHKKDNLEIYKNSLSQQPEVIRRYFEQPMPKRKREREWGAFQELLGAYGADDVAACLEFVLAKGVPGSGERCHSPLAFLSSAMAQVLLAVRAMDQKTNHQAQDRARRALRVATETEADQADAAAAEAREKAFSVAFPQADAQAAIIAAFAAQNPILVPSSVITRRLAIAQWWETSHPNGRVS